MIENMLKDITDYLIDNNGAIIIYPKTNEENYITKRKIKDLNLPIKYCDLSVEGKNILLLRYYPYIEDYSSYLIKNMRVLNKSKSTNDFEKALVAGLNLLKVGNPYISSYMGIAIIYLRLEDLENALKYLNIVYYLDKYNNEDSKNTEEMIEHIKKVIEICNDPELIELYDSLIFSIDDYLKDHNQNIHINIKKDEYDLFKRIINEYQYLTYSSINKKKDFNVTIKNNQRKRI